MFRFLTNFLSNCLSYMYWSFHQVWRLDLPRCSCVLRDLFAFIGTRKRLIGLHGVLVGVGEILGKLSLLII